MKRILILAVLPLFGCATLTPDEKTQARAVGLAVGRAALDIAVALAKQQINNGLESLPPPKGFAK